MKEKTVNVIVLVGEISAAGRAGTPDEVANVGAFITASDSLMDGGVTAAYWYGEPNPNV